MWMWKYWSYENNWSNKDCRLFVDKINKSKSAKRTIDPEESLMISSNAKIFKSAHKYETIIFKSLSNARINQTQTPSNHSVNKYYWILI